MAEKKLTIYYTSDLHGYIYPTNYRQPGEMDIGLFKCEAQFQKDGDTLVIDGGDLLQGSPFGAYCHNVLQTAYPLAEIMNGCGYDYVTLGNHDFNYGMEYLDSYLKALHADCVCENVYDADGAVRFPARIRTLRNGLRIGLVGIVTDYVNVWEKPEHLAGIRICEPLEAARKALEKLKGQTDLMIGIYHGGFEQDLTTGQALTTSTENIACKLCRELDFDILLTGHQHMSVPGQMLYGTFVVQPSENGKEFAQISVTLKNGKKQITSCTHSAGGDCAENLLQKFSDVEAGAQTWLDEVVGYLDEPLLPSDPLSMASGGSRLADFFNEVQRTASGAMLSATSLANEIAGLPQTVHRRDLLTAYPYTNTLVVLRINGAVLRKALERSAEYFSRDAEGRLCVSEGFLYPKVEHYNYDYYMGVEYEFDISRPTGNRVVKLLYEGKPVNDEDSFSICLNSYRASGTGGYSCYQGCPVEREIDMEMSELLADYFEKHKSHIRFPRQLFKIR